MKRALAACVCALALLGSSSLALRAQSGRRSTPEPKGKKVMADLYRVTRPDDSVLENGSKLCKGKPVAFLIVWKSDTNSPKG